MDTVSYLPLSDTVTLHNISTSDVAINGIYGMPTSPYYGQVIHIKDFGGYSSVGNIILTYTNSNLLLSIKKIMMYCHMYIMV